MIHHLVSLRQSQIAPTWPDSPRLIIGNKLESLGHLIASDLRLAAHQPDPTQQFNLLLISPCGGCHFDFLEPSPDFTTLPHWLSIRIGSWSGRSQPQTVTIRFNCDGPRRISNMFDIYAQFGHKDWLFWIFVWLWAKLLRPDCNPTDLLSRMLRICSSFHQ